MKSKICLALLVAALLLSALTACAASSPQSLADSPMRGSWDENVFTSEHLGLSFTKPILWNVASDEEIAEIMGLGLEMLEMEMDVDAFMEVADVLVFHDMVAANPLTGASVQIIFERLVFPANRLSAPEYIERASQTLVEMGMDVNLDFPGTTRIGDYDWYSYESILEVHGTNIYGRYFVSVQGGFARIIAIIYHDGSESLENILAMFS